jgi:mannose-6-phosphate isomerase-like protein (cupin superfamily)
MRRFMVAAVVAMAFASPAVAAPKIIRLPLTGGETDEPYKLPNGVTIGNTSFFSSEASGVSVGRSNIHGPHLKETTDYVDVFMIMGGGGEATFNGKPETFGVGDVVLMPKGTTFESKNINRYIHFFASFEHGGAPTATPGAPVRRLQPEAVPATQYQSADGYARHVYYTAPNGVRVEAHRYADRKDKAARTADDSRVLFVVSGGGVLEADGEKVTLAPRQAVVIPKGTTYRLEAKNLSAVAVVFDQLASK